MPTVIMKSGRSIVLELAQSLPYRRLWNYTILAYGCEEHPITDTTELSEDTSKAIIMHLS